MRCLTQLVSLVAPRRPDGATNDVDIYSRGSASLWRYRGRQVWNSRPRSSTEVCAQARRVTGPKLPMAGARSETKPRRSVRLGRSDSSRRMHRVPSFRPKAGSRPQRHDNKTPSSYLVFNSRSSSVIIETGKCRTGELYPLTAAGSSCCWSHSKNSMPASALISSPASRPIFSASAGAPTLLER